MIGDVAERRTFECDYVPQPRQRQARRVGRKREQGQDEARRRRGRRRGVRRERRNGRPEDPVPNFSAQAPIVADGAGGEALAEDPRRLHARENAMAGDGGWRAFRKQYSDEGPSPTRTGPGRGALPSCEGCIKEWARRNHERGRDAGERMHSESNGNGGARGPRGRRCDRRGFRDARPTDRERDVPRRPGGRTPSASRTARSGSGSPRSSPRPSCTTRTSRGSRSRCGSADRGRSR